MTAVSGEGEGEPERFELVGADGGALRLDFYDARASRNSGSAPPMAFSPTPRAVVLCHGFRGWKDWGFLPFLATKLAGDGIAAVTFNFSSSGITDAAGTFEEPERFRRGTYGGDLADLRTVIDWTRRRIAGEAAGDQGPRGSQPDNSPALGLAGHSRGGVTALLHAARDRSVRAVATLGAPSRIGVWPESYFEAWRRGLPADVYDFRTRRTLALGPDLYADWERHGGEYDTVAAAASLQAPLLVVHGRRDSLVPLSEAEALAALGRSTSTELRVVEGAGHSFQAGDTMRRTPPPLLDMVEAVAAWMRRWVGRNEIGDYFFSPGT